MSYKLYQSDFIKNNHNQFLKECSLYYQNIKSNFNIKDTTWEYHKYNIFGATSPSYLFYTLYNELNYHIRSFIGDNRPLWIQSWLNYHKSDEITNKSLGFHGHDTNTHGYISINPQSTITKFRNGLEIINKIGQIYIGPSSQSEQGKNGEWDHEVITLSKYTSPRITIAFDITDNSKYTVNPKSFIPLL